ncbi:E3 ubiquitin-protein ligase TRIM32-like [Ischnura elegans]|uniref:E3 ubiquitin-protein ligase TRIM32-like n=1 Tax=Ischnura elegans TaxID=197161 RepID=UPI001ED88488|nr:E3 ubiquitin-protein ligase TRIM32-like [Ischnura elegans]
MSSHKGEHHPSKGPLRSLRRMLSLDRIFPSAHEQEEDIGGYRHKAQHEVEEDAKPKVASATVRFDTRRRQSWNRDVGGGGEEAGGGNAEDIRTKILRLKSYPPVNVKGGDDPEVLEKRAQGVPSGMHHRHGEGDGPEVQEKRAQVAESGVHHRHGGDGPEAHEKRGHTAESGVHHRYAGSTARRTMSEAPAGKPRRPQSLHSAAPKGTASSPDPASRTSSSEKRVEELLECAVCLERLKEPRTLPCDHTFCLNCLKTQMSSPLGSADGSAGVVKCPTCRRDAAIPRQGGLASLPTNIYLESLLRVLSERPPALPQTPPPSGSGCSKCGNGGLPHLYICGHCQQVLCKDCLPEHLKEMKQEMLEIQEKIKGVTQRLEEAEKEFTVRFQHLRSQVEAERDQRVAQVAEDSRRLLDRVSALEAERMQGGRELRQRLVGALANCSADEFENTASESKVEMFLNARREASGLLTQASTWSERARSHLTFDRTNFRILDPEDEEDEEEKEGAEEEEEEEGVEGVAGGAERGRREAEGRRRSAARALPTTHDELSLYYRSRSMTSPRWRWGGTRGCGGNELYRPAGLAVSPWAEGELYVAASDGGRVSVFTRRSGSGWKYSRTLATPPGKERMLCPFGVAFSEARAEVYVSDKWCHCIHVYDTQGNWLRRFSKSGRSPGSLSSPEGIAANDSHIFVADTGNDRVQVFNASDGSFVTFVGSEVSSFKREPDVAEPSPGSGYLRQPSGVALSADHSKLVVCDSGHNRIKIFDTSGLLTGDLNVPLKPVCVFGSLGSQRGQLRSARGVAIDRMGFVVVADSGNARVQIFRPNGTLVRAIGSQGKEAGQFGYPSAVHVGPLFELFVSDANNHCISVF